MSIASRARFTRSLKSALLGFTLAGAIASAAPLQAATESSAGECRLTSLARQALDNDAQLAALNLGVSVRDEVATVWGAVPSPAMANRAVTCLGRVPGVARVENQLTVESPSDPLVDFLKMPARPLSPKPIPGIRVLDLTATAPSSIRTSHGPVPVWQPAPVFTPGPAPVFAPVPVAGSPVVGPKLASRTPDAAAPAPPISMPRILLPAQSADPREAKDLPLGVADLQQGKGSLRGIKPEVRGGVVYLRGSIRDWEELHAFARQISQLPGVERVVLDGIRTSPR